MLWNRVHDTEPQNVLCLYRRFSEKVYIYFLTIPLLFLLLIFHSIILSIINICFFCPLMIRIRFPAKSMIPDDPARTSVQKIITPPINRHSLILLTPEKKPSDRKEIPGRIKYPAASKYPGLFPAGVFSISFSVLIISATAGSPASG